jgi:hypothetical protein
MASSAIHGRRHRLARECRRAYLRSKGFTFWDEARCDPLADVLAVMGRGRELAEPLRSGHAALCNRLLPGLEKMGRG